jgi:hypothetical protein
VHVAALGIAALCSAYNAAAWLVRREDHLAVNALLYGVLIAWEQRHVAHHIAELRRPAKARAATTRVPESAALRESAIAA